MDTHGLPDRLWSMMAPLLRPERPRGGRLPVLARRVLAASWFVMRTG